MPRGCAKGGLLERLPVDAQVEETVLEVGGVFALMSPSPGHGRTEVLVEPVLDHLIVNDAAAAPVEADEVAVEPRPRNLNVHGVSSELSDLNEGRQVYLRSFVPGLDVVVPLQPQAGELEVAGLEHVLDDAVAMRPGVEVTHESRPFRR